MEIRDLSVLVRETLEISDLIRKTPRVSRKEVEEYHSGIIKRLDSGEIIQVPSAYHRNLHQETWVAAHMVYKNFTTFDSAFFDFIAHNNDAGEFKSQRVRFDLWYDKTYIQPFLKEHDPQYNWAKKIDLDTEEEAKVILNKELNEVEIFI